jgi:hypothetical protein
LCQPVLRLKHARCRWRPFEHTDDTSQDTKPAAIRLRPSLNLEGGVFKSQTQRRFNLDRDADLHITHVHALKPVLWLVGFMDVITTSFAMHN